MDRKVKKQSHEVNGTCRYICTVGVKKLSLYRTHITTVDRRYRTKKYAEFHTLARMYMCITYGCNCVLMVSPIVTCEKLHSFHTCFIETDNKLQ